ncbi:hypothetical protein AB0M36_05900 [Actinoplanes sp. NPDC051346]|uniref:hypothetical protein n=1 Tax=Actinoplanes sp. NPDC051346 TaxID=3155048 RepID=UPI003425D051
MTSALSKPLRPAHWALTLLPWALVAAAWIVALLSYLSPSQTYAMPLLGLLVAIAVDLLRGRPLGPAWFLVPPLALACAGAKSSALPPLVAGLTLAGLVAWWQHRRFPRAVAGFLAALVGAMVIGALLFAGGGAGTLGLQPLSLLRWMEPYRSTLGSNDGVAPGGLIAPGVQGAGTAGAIFIVGILSWWMLTQGARLIGVAFLRRRTDPAAWLLGGMVAAGFDAALLLWHPSASQLYFLLCAAPFGVVLTVWMLAERSRHWWTPVAGLVAGAVWASCSPTVTAPANDTKSGWAWALAVPLLRVAGLVLVAAILLILLRRPLRLLVVAVTAAVLGASIATGAAASAKSLWRSTFGREAPPPPTARTITREEMRAALWLSDHARNDDVVATNVHCVPVARSKPCDARAFWVAGLGGRRTLVESWGYSDATVAANGVDGLKYVLQPPPDPSTYALNQRVFTTADPTDVAQLHEAYGVRWLLADRRAGPVSPRLAVLARVRYSSGSVTVYELGA